MTLVDFYQLVTERGGATEDKNCLIRNIANSRSRDGVHPTPEGYQLLAENIAALLKDKVKPGAKIICFGDSITYGAHVQGAGTIFGETYPAWLSVYLNNAIGASSLRQPPSMPKKTKSSNLLPNGSFELTTDTVHPDGWKIWNVPRRQVGNISIAKNGAKDGKNCLLIVNDKPEKPSFVTTSKIKITAGHTYKISYWIKGSGKLFPMIGQYAKRKNLPSFVPDKISKWKQANADWTNYTFKFTASSKTKYITVVFRTRGTVHVDAVLMTPDKPMEQKKSIKVVGKTFELKNRRVLMKFYPSAQGGGIINIKSKSGFEFINAATNGLLWKLQLRSLPVNSKTSNGIIRLTLDPEQDDAGGTLNDDIGKSKILTVYSNKINVHGTVKKTPGQLLFSWKGIDIEKETGVLDVWVKVSMSKEDDFVRFTSGFSNRSRKYTVFYCYSPMVSGIYPRDGKLTQDYLATPVHTGRLIKNPIKNGLLGKRYRFQPNRSGHSMQFDAYYHNDDGLYLGCLDEKQNAKRYYMAVSPKSGLEWAAVYVPNNIKTVPQIWKTPYPAVIRCFQGNWFDAAQIYRKWAIQQSWTSEGPLAQRTSTPKWFLEMGDWYNTSLQEWDHMKPSGFLKAAKPYDIGFSFFHWGKYEWTGPYMSPDRFPVTERTRKAFDKVKSDGFRLMAYIQSIMWDRNTSSFKKFASDGEASIQNYDLKDIVFKEKKKGKPHSSTAQIVWPGKIWTRVLGNTVEKMVRAGVDVAYFDSGNHGGTYLNFNPRYSNDKNRGGGNSYIKGQQKLIRDIKKRIRRIKPGFCVTAESFWEGNMGVLDGYLACNTTLRYLKGDEVTAIPLAHAVYHDYALFYSAWISKYDCENNQANSLMVKLAQLFVWGVKPGFSEKRYYESLPNYKLASKFKAKLYEAYACSKKYLVYGEMLRPSVVVSPEPPMDVNWYRGFKKNYYKIKSPVITTSTWRAPDGSVAIVAFNHSDKEKRVRLQYSSADYGFERKNKYFAIGLYPKMGEASISSNGDGTRQVVELIIPGRSPAVYELTKR